MGWRGTLRSIAAAQRAAERAAVRRQRELARQHKAYAKMVELEAAEYEVEVYENQIDVLASIHKDSTTPINWDSILTSPEPLPPPPTKHREREAAAALANYRPNFLDKLLRRVEDRRAALSRAVAEAKRADAAEHEAAMQRHESNLADWLDSRDLAGRVLAGESAAYLEVLQEMNPFEELGSLGSSVGFNVAGHSPVEVSVHVHAEDVIPKEVKSLTQSGKLSVKKMPIGRFYEVYQDYVAACMLRVAREVFSLLPVQAVVATALGEVLDTATGHLEERPILSVAMPRQSVDRINFETVDPSDALKNFLHRMDFKKTKGFAAVERIAPSELEASP